MDEEQTTGAPSSEGALRKIAICGTADSLKAAPFGDKSFEIWGVSPCVTYPAWKRCDLLFELHPRSYWEQVNADGQYVIARLNGADCPVLMQDHYDAVPKSIKFPIDEVTGRYYRNYTSSIAYMIAYAIHEGAGHIALFGVHMAADEEYGSQRAGCEYWIGVAQGLGIDVWNHPESSVCACKFQYGYEPENPVLAELRKTKEGLELGMEQVLAQEQEQHDQRMKNQGAILLAEKVLKENGMWGVNS